MGLFLVGLLDNKGTSLPASRLMLDMVVHRATDKQGPRLLKVRDTRLPWVGTPNQQKEPDTHQWVVALRLNLVVSKLVKLAGTHRKQASTRPRQVAGMDPRQVGTHLPLVVTRRSQRKLGTIRVKTGSETPPLIQLLNSKG